MEYALMPRKTAVEFVWDVRMLADLRNWRTIGLARATVRQFTHVLTDTRQASGPGFLFVALSGANFDGHRFVADAVAKGAAGVVVAADSGIRAPGNVITYIVEDTRKALGQIAMCKRAAFAGKVAVLTGSAGKTTTKSIAAALAGKQLYVNPGNFNNDIGVPLSIIAAPLNISAWLLELGMNAAGEIEALTNLVSPDYGLLLPAGRAHAGAFSTLEDIARAKAEMASAAKRPKQLLVYGSGYDNIFNKTKVTRIGLQANTKYDCRFVAARFPAGSTFELREPNWSRRIETSLHGQHWQVALGAAWGLLREMGLLERKHADRLGRVALPPGRMQLLPYRGGWLLNDSYNASPESYLTFMDYLATLDKRLKVRLVLGDMYELGRRSDVAHREVADRVKTLKPAMVIATGKRIQGALSKAGIAFVVGDGASDALTAGFGRWQPGSFLAVKGANGTGLFDALCERGLGA